MVYTSYFFTEFSLGLDFQVGLRYHPKNFFIGIAYVGSFAEKFKAYENIGKVEFGYVFMINDRISIEPSVFYLKSLTSPNVNRIGIGVDIGIGLN